MKKIIFFYLFMFLCKFGISQSSQNKITEPNFKSNTLSKSNAQVIRSSDESLKSSEEKKSDYMGMEKYILERVNVKTIPASCPKATVGQSKNEYKNSLYAWAKAHITYIKPEYIQEINDYKNQ